MAFTWAPRGSRWAAASAVALALWASAAPTLVYPAYAAEWHLTTAVTTTVFAAYPVALIGTLLLLGGFAETVGSRNAILAGLGFLGLGALTFLLAPNLALLLTGRALMGIGVGLSLGPATSVIASAVRDGVRDRTGAITAGASSVGIITALLVGGATVQFGSSPLHSGYGVLLAGVAVAVLAVWFLPRSLPSPARATAGRWRPRRLAVPQRRMPFLAGTFGVSAAYALAAVAGQALMITAGATHSMPFLVLYSLVGGAGYSLLFSGGVTLVTQSAPAEHRAATTSSAYLVAYLVQAVVALGVGALGTAVDLQTALVAGSATVVALTLAALLPLRSRVSAPGAVPALPIPSHTTTSQATTSHDNLMKASSSR
jgi:MFS family permease